MKNILAILFLFASSGLIGQITLPKLISDGVVLQRDESVKIWGWASPGEIVEININDLTLSCKTNDKGDWSATMPPQKSGGPYRMTISGKNKITIENVLFGDVWLCAGQSNMVLNMERVKEKYPDDIKTADYPEIRNFFIPTTTNLMEPQPDLKGSEWKPVSPETVLNMGAVTYFFARELYDQYQIPIGIINSSVGGTPIEAWTSEEGLKEFPDLMKKIQQNKDTSYIKSMYQQPESGSQSRPADLGMEQKWYEPSYKLKGWQTINIPGYWEDQGIRDLNGIVWYRREIEIPESMLEKDLKLFMGRIVDADYVYVNGKQVGNITYQYPPRRYTIPKNLLKPGKNTIVVRVINYGGKGGFVPDKPYYITANGNEIDLKGTWKYKVGAVFPPATGPGRPNFSAQNQPAALYNAMIAPITNMKIKGFLWNQGESNVWRAQEYYDLLPALIQDWRNKWQQEKLPFIYVQLANFQDATYLPVESQWAVLRDAQLRALQVPETAMAVAIDLGEWNDIHPLNKKGVGVRMALAARNLAYGEKDLVYSGPIYKSQSAEGDKIRLKFNHIGNGLTTSDGENPSYFAIAGHDKNFVWANAAIDDNSILVWNEEVKNPQYVRYGWADNPFGANLINKEGLPASPFRTDYHPEYEDLLWKGKKAAVVLTYDDAIYEQLINAVPVLDKYNLKATFYITAAFPGCKEHLEDWKKVARNGHELGNHTLFHPCDNSDNSRNWIQPHNDLSRQSVTELMAEIEMNNTFLEALDGQKERTFAYPCGNMTTSDGSYKNDLDKYFIASRGVRSALNKVEDIDMNNINSYVISGQTASEMIEWVEEAINENALITFLFHGVGGGHGADVSREDHRQFVEYLYNQQDKIWVTTMLEAAKNIEMVQEKIKQ